MPITLSDQYTRTRVVDLKKLNIDYDYPEGLNLKPGSELHERLVTMINERARESANVMVRRHSFWNKIDETLTTYIDLDSDEEDLIDLDHRKPVSIVLPYSYAIMETILGYLVSAFFQDPIFRYEGTSARDVVGAILLEKVIGLHCDKSKVALNLHTLFRDGLSYGMGVVAPDWRVKYGKRSVRVETPVLSLDGVPLNQGGLKRGVDEVVLFEGNALTNIDPYLCLPDVNTPIHEVQESEYFAWVDYTNLMEMLNEEKNSDGDMFNVKYLRHMQNKQTSIYSSDKSKRNEKTLGGNRNREISGVTNPVDVINMYITLIPEDFGLGDGEYPEKWLFQLAGDSVITKAQRLNFNHEMYPIAVCAPDFDGYSTTPISRIEILSGMQGTLDWLFNTHVANVRKAVNDMFVVDPYSVNIRDVENPGPGKIIRTRRPVWGQGVQNSIMQFPTQDITRGHIADSAYIIDAMQKVGGASDAEMGALRSGGPERLTRGEFQGTQQGAFTRLERMARIIGLQAMQDIGYFFASHTQQFMNEDSYIKITGRSQERLIQQYGADLPDSRLTVSPFDLLIDYQVKVRDGSIPGGNYSNVWERMFETIAQIPELGEQFDLIRIFKHIARNNGAKNVDEFVNIQARPEETIEDQLQQGNLVPTNV